MQLHRCTNNYGWLNMTLQIYMQMDTALNFHSPNWRSPSYPTPNPPLPFHQHQYSTPAALKKKFLFKIHEKRPRFGQRSINKKHFPISPNIIDLNKGLDLESEPLDLVGKPGQIAKHQQ